MARRRPIRVYLGLGANVGDPARTLADAVGSLDELRHVRVRGVSRLYATAPWGITDQPEFRNAVVAIDLDIGDLEPTAAALDLLGRLKTLERQAGRRRRVRWGPRELDIDLLVFGRHRISVERPTEAGSIDAAVDPAKAFKRLEVPHRDFGERLFVLAPLADIAAHLVPPGWAETVATRARAVAASEPPGSVRVVGDWDPVRRSWRRASSG
jgi:2-amino-4-hydroxy-6-hydroxymethyldihydropteridine diphosphokinase